MLAHWRNNYDIGQRITADWARIGKRLNGKIHVTVTLPDPVTIAPLCDGVSIVLTSSATGVSATLALNVYLASKVAARNFGRTECSTTMLVTSASRQSGPT